MNPSVEEGKDLMLRVYAKELRAQRPGLTHARSYQLAQEQHPELAEEFASEASASQPYRYIEKPAPKLDMEAILRRYGGPAKVEADKKDDDGEQLMLVMAADGSIDHLELR